MREADFRILFVGIETPDPALLKQARKAQNAARPIAEQVRRIYRHGMLVTAGFILGFDNEPAGSDAVLAGCIEETHINLAMVGLLTALPNTQLSRRLQREGRLLDADGARVPPDADGYCLENREGLDNASGGGLNYVPTRPREEILREYRDALARVYEPRAYMDRVLRMARLIEGKPRCQPTPARRRQLARGARRLSVHMARDPQLRWLYLRNVAACARLGPLPLQHAMTAMALYVHLRAQTQRVIAALDAAPAAPASP